MTSILTKSQKKLLISIIAGALLFLLAIIIGNYTEINKSFQIMILTLSYIILGYKVIKTSLKNIKKGKVFDENFLMTIATIGAYILGDFDECVAVMLFYQIGEFFQSYAVAKSRKSVKELMDICPEYANIEKDGQLLKVDPYKVNIGDTIIVKPGEKVPLDAVVIEGSSSLDTSSLTGEAMPCDVKKGDLVYSGCVNLNSNLKLKVTKTYENSSVSKILELVENSMFNKSKSERFITRFARIYTPAVVICALLTFLVPSIIKGSYLLWLRRSLIFLVISCPCALVISVPLCFFASIGCASKRGILIKGANYMEALGNIETIVFDKTGTLTKGVFEITDICPIGCTKEELLENLSACEYYSNHPISKCIKDAFSIKSINDITDFENLSGLGVSVTYKGKKLYAGNQRLMEMQGIENVPLGLTKAIIHLCCDNTYMGYVLIADKIKKEAYKTIEKLKKSGIKTCMLTGDSKDNANVTKEKLGIEMVFSNLLPNDKVTHLNKILKNKTSKKSTVAYVGDGINDAPVLSLADVGISMGSLGSDAAIEASDIVITDDNISKILLAIKICKSTITIVKQNVVFAIGVKFLIMLLGVMGIANMWAAVFADVGVSFIAILNALRAFKIR